MYYTMVYPSRNVELLKNLLDQTIVLYGAFGGGLFVVIAIVLFIWFARRGYCYSWVHNAGLETLWTLVPVVYLGLALVHGVGVLYGMESVRSYSAGSGKTIQIIGHQWYWEYVLGGWKHGAVESRMVSSNALDFGSVRLTTVDQPVYIGTEAAVQLAVTSADVIHCWSVPALGIKLDGIPGRTSMVGMQSLTAGVYSGYCAELCGSGHGFMPIQVIAYSASN